MANNGVPAVIEKFEVPAVSGDIGELMNEELDGLSFQFDRVKIPTGGGLAFEIPGETEDEVETVREIVGVIVDQHAVNAYWKEQYSGQNNPPDCSALDGKHGTGDPGGDCRTCPYNQWGSDPLGSGGKACKNMRRIYILREGDMFPLLLTLPPTSLKNFANYLAKRVVAKRKRSCEVVTKITLKKAQSNTGITYSQAVFSLVGILPPEMAEKMRQYSESIKPITRAIGIEVDDYVQNGDSSEDDDIF